MPGDQPYQLPSEAAADAAAVLQRAVEAAKDLVGADSAAGKLLGSTGLRRHIEKLRAMDEKTTVGAAAAALRHGQMRLTAVPVVADDAASSADLRTTLANELAELSLLVTSTRQIRDEILRHVGERALRSVNVDDFSNVQRARARDEIALQLRRELERTRQHRGS